jgi:hypothetical protein
VRPHPLIHRGVVLAHGLVCASRADALAHWSSADQLLEGADGVVVLWNQTRELRAEAAAGSPLVRCGAGLCTAPVHVPDGLFTVRAGALQPLRATAVDPARWLVLHDVPVHRLKSLAAPPPPAAAVVEDVPTGRALFADLVGDAAPDAAEVLFEATPNAPPVWLFQAAGGLLQWLRKRGPKTAGAGGPSAAGGGSSALAPSGPSWMQRFEDKLAAWLRSSGLDALLAPAQARYLAKMMQLFDTQDWEQALLHAIPLDGEGGLEKLATRLTARSGLHFGGGGGPAARIDLGDALRERMRRYYERALDALRAQERWREAAYVQCELLNQPAQAVSMLEDAKQWALAAELAESRKLPDGHVIALWFRAGQVARATALARRSEAWQDVYQRLNARDPKLGLRWRMAWAASLIAEQRGSQRAEAEAAHILLPRDGHGPPTTKDPGRHSPPRAFTLRPAAPSASPLRGAWLRPARRPLGCAAPRPAR